MPYKVNEKRRHRLPKARYRVQNWRDYDAALRRRGDLTVWVTPAAMAAWTPPPCKRRGRPQKYSEIAVETGLMLRLAFGRPWRQTEGMLASILHLLGLNLPVPDHTTFSRRSANLAVAKALSTARGPVNVVIDATGLKVFGAGEWQREKHGGQGHRTWRKLHLAIDPDTGEILASELTTTEDGDASQVGPLLDQISSPIASVTADGAYDGEPVYRTIAERDPAAAVIIPPRSTAVPSNTAETAPTQRDRHLQMIQARGRLGWQRAVNYGRRSLGEVAMMRYKALIGRHLHARTLSKQKAEAAAGCKVINVMPRLGMPVSQRLVRTPGPRGACGPPLNYAPTSAHGPCAPAMAFRVVDSKAAYERAISLGAKPADVSRGSLTLDIPVVEGIGGSLLYFVDTYGSKGSVYDSAFDWTGERDPRPEGVGLFYLDHLTHNVHRGRMNVWAGFYERIFNFRQIRYFDIEGKMSGLYSKALTSPDRKIRIPINEDAGEAGQIEEYLQEYKGEGIQHIACGCEDIYSAIEKLRADGVTFMPSPPSVYYKRVDKRVPGHGEDLDRLARNGILIDGEGVVEGGYTKVLLQLFSANAIGPIFFEFIQRKGDDGFGEGNFKALFESIEEDQIRRGVLKAPDAAE